MKSAQLQENFISNCGQHLEIIKRRTALDIIPIKLAIEGSENHLTFYTSLGAIIIRKLNTIEEGKKNGTSKFMDRRLYQRGGFFWGHNHYWEKRDVTK